MLHFFNNNVNIFRKNINTVNLSSATSTVINKEQHPFHLVDPSPWPILAAFSALACTTGGVGYMHGYISGSAIMFGGLFGIFVIIYTWWRDITREGTFEGQHTGIVQIGLRYGILLFIASEVIFFFAFFWAFFWSSLAPTPDIGSVWPPQGVMPIGAWEIPFLNTRILLTSGATVTWAHHAIVCGNHSEAVVGRTATVLLAAAFTGFQVYEYANATFRISDSVYGSTFYRATGFHGFHVFVGTCFLIVCLIRLLQTHFSRYHHFGFEAAAWYWHFVDVVWLFLFCCVYWWGGQ